MLRTQLSNINAKGWSFDRLIDISRIFVSQIDDIIVNQQTNNKMGNNNSTQIEIKLDKPAYFPGETINAVICINAPKQHLCSRIVLHIEGYEESQFTSEVGNKDLLNSRNTILRTFFVLFDFNSATSFLQGQYEYPCMFTLPWTIPGSFSESKSNYKSKILYHLKVILVAPHKASQNFQKAQEIIIRQPPKQIDSYRMNQINIYPECFCWKKLGVCKVKGWFQKKNYIPNDDCIVICQIDNSKSKRDLKRVKCEFKRTITLRSSNGVKKEIKEILNTVEFQGAKKGQTLIGPLAQKVILPLKYKNTKNGVLPSTTGHLVRCEYTVEVTPEVGGCFTKGNKTFKVNLQILHADLVHTIKKPQVWQPQVHCMSKIELVQKNQKEMRKSIMLQDLNQFATD